MGSNLNAAEEVAIHPVTVVLRVIMHLELIRNDGSCISRRHAKKAPRTEWLHVGSCWHRHFTTKFRAFLEKAQGAQWVMDLDFTLQSLNRNNRNSCRSLCLKVLKHPNEPMDQPILLWISVKVLRESPSSCILHYLQFRRQAMSKLSRLKLEDRCS